MTATSTSSAPGSAAHFNAELPHLLAAEGGPAEIVLVAAKPNRTVHNIH